MMRVWKGLVSAAELGGWCFVGAWVVGAMAPPSLKPGIDGSSWCAVFDKVSHQRAEAHRREELRALRQVGDRPPLDFRHRFKLVGDRVARRVCHEPFRAHE